ARAEKGRALLVALLDVSAPRETRAYARGDQGRMTAVAQPSVDEQYAAAFRRWGLDVDGTAEEDVVARLRAEPGPGVEEGLAGLDGWMLARRRQKGPEAGWRRLVRVAGQLDPSGRRRQLRALLAGASQPHEEVVAGLTRALLPWTALCELEHGPDWRRLLELRGGGGPGAGAGRGGAPVRPAGGGGAGVWRERGRGGGHGRAAPGRDGAAGPGGAARRAGQTAGAAGAPAGGHRVLPGGPGPASSPGRRPGQGASQGRTGGERRGRVARPGPPAAGQSRDALSTRLRPVRAEEAG